MFRAIPRLFIPLASVLAPVAGGPAVGQLPDPDPTPQFPCIRIPGHPCPSLPFDAQVDGPAALEVAPAAGESRGRRTEVLGWSWGKVADAETVYSSDPQEGGQISGRMSADPQVGGQVAGRKAGSIPPEWRAQVAEPLPSGTLTIRVARGFAVQGKHIPEVRLSAKGRTYRLRDVEVAQCASADDETEICALTYQSLGD